MKKKCQGKSAKLWKNISADIKVSQISTDFFRSCNCFRKGIGVFASSSKQGGVSKITNKNSKKKNEITAIALFIFVLPTGMCSSSS